MSSDGMPRVVAKRLGYAMKRVQHALRLSMDKALAPAALNAPQYAILCALEAEPGLSNARLARAAFVTAQSMQGMLAKLERSGLLERHSDPTNARILRARLTPHGKVLLVQAHDLVAKVERVLTRSFGQDDVDRLAVSLTTCADNLLASRK